MNKEQRTNDFDDFSILAKWFIYKYGTPHSAIVITQSGIEVLSGCMAKSFLKNEKEE